MSKQQHADDRLFATASSAQVDLPRVIFVAGSGKEEPENASIDMCEMFSRRRDTATADPLYVVVYA
jgi:hypothetical protein